MAIPNSLTNNQFPQTTRQDLPTGGNILNIPRFKQNQSDFYDQLLNYSAAKLQNPYQGFEPIRQQAQNQFNQNIGNISERFAGGNSALSSPAFASQLGAENSRFNTDLAALQSQYGMQNENQALAFADRGLTPQYENVLQPSQYQELLGGLAQSGPKYAELLGKGIKGYFGNNSGPEKGSNTLTESGVPAILSGVAEGAAPAVGGALGGAAANLLKNNGPSLVKGTAQQLAKTNPALTQALINKAGTTAAQTAGGSALGSILGTAGGALAAGATAALPVLAPALGALATVGGLTYLVYKLFDYFD